jgi:hypothetical protein
VEQGEKIIVAGGGRVIEEGGEKYYLINKNAVYLPPLEISRVPDLIFEVGEPVEHEIKASVSDDRLTWASAESKLPSGLKFEGGRLIGTPAEPGEYDLNITASLNDERQSARIPFTVFERNMAAEANGLVAHVHKAVADRRDKMWITVGRNLLSDDVSIINDGTWKGDRSVFYSVCDLKTAHEDFYGYLWDQEQEIGNIAFRTGPMEENGAWFQSLRVEYQDDSGDWVEAEGLNISPDFDTTNLELNKAHFINYRLDFDPVKSKGVRIIGQAGGGSHWQASSNNIYYTSITELAVYPPLDQQIRAN